MNQPKVIYTDKGLANYYGDHIRINYALRKDKALRDYIVKHELGHTRSFDLGHEIQDGIKLMSMPQIAYKLLWFYLTHPSTWYDLLPIQYENNKLVYDLNLLILYSSMLIAIVAAFKFL